MMKKNMLAGLVILAIIPASLTSLHEEGRNQVPDRHLITKTGVCPPFYLYSENGSLIDPVHGINGQLPYSPRQTCGKCHDYDKITEGFHFQQGKDEMASGVYAERYQWASTPGNYGGNWCSPAPLYSYLSPKENASVTEMDMTSFTFITNGCGTCHPGGGSFEFDRNGKHYPEAMKELEYTDGGANDFDGDYYQAHWGKSGVGEGDCMLCHLPEYDFKGRNAHLLKWNFAWMATAGSGLAAITGSVKDSVPHTVTYDISKFDKEGKLSMHLVREPRNETCLNCHAKPQWKKRGASFTAETDVHMAKGMKCVDCHPAGSIATDERINGKEVHQFGKGDDPGGHVRDDLDNTMRTCTDCHLTGYLNAPIANHSWLPSFHLDDLSCQACHIPERRVKAALAQVSDVYNPGTKISPPPKYIWTFYDQHMNYWNHYGEISMFTAADQPSDPFIPQYAKYKDQIFPVNPVHSAWPGIYTPGKPGLHQPRMKDVYAMWTKHRKDQTFFPELALIRDDNGDSIPEVNRPEEIDAVINSLTDYLTGIGYDFTNRQVVWVNNDRMYKNGTTWEVLDKEEWESSPYASVYKYNHDVSPAKAGLGAKGCTECHSFSSPLFYASVVKYPFGEDGNPVFEPQYKRMGMSGFFVWLSAFREQILKSIEYPAFLFLVVIIILAILLQANRTAGFLRITATTLWITYGILLAAFLLIYLKPDLNSYILPERMWMDKNHFWISGLAILAGIYTCLEMRKAGKKPGWPYRLQNISIWIAVVSGLLMMIRFEAVDMLVRLAYSVFDVSVVISIFLTICYFIGGTKQKAFFMGFRQSFDE
ncbi:MAG: hypothetical protein JXA23_07365 [Bacteroidales bacterium]|nr:hypothetical protein [Bacteroidales bacterium]